MNKLFAAAVAVGFMIAPCLPAMADGDDTASSTTIKATGGAKTNKASKTSDKAKSKTSATTVSEDINANDVVNAVSSTALHLTKFTVGLGVGAPVAMLRRTLRQTHDTSKNVAGDNNTACCVLTQALMLPTVGVVVGGLDGLSWSVSNSWKNSWEPKPFEIKKEMFSLGALDD
jgi:hypothetical protein